VGPDVGDAWDKWSGFVEGEDGSKLIHILHVTDFYVHDVIEYHGHSSMWGRHIDNQ